MKQSDLIYPSFMHNAAVYIRQTQERLDDKAIVDVIDALIEIDELTKQRSNNGQVTLC